MTFKEFMRENEERIESITIHNNNMRFFSNKIEFVSFIQGDNGSWELSINDLTLKLEEWQVSKEESFRLDNNLWFYDLAEFKIDFKLK